MPLSSATLCGRAQSNPPQLANVRSPVLDFAHFTHGESPYRIKAIRSFDLTFLCIDLNISALSWNGNQLLPPFRS